MSDLYQPPSSSENAPDSSPLIPDEPKKEPINVKKELLSWVLTIVIAVVAAFVIRTFVFEPVRVDGSSMADTLHTNEMVFVTKFD